MDFRSLNKITKCDNYPIPNIDHLIKSCRHSKVFSQLDLASGYWCVPIAEKDRHKTAFSVPKGKFEFVRMPFGLGNSQATFQRLMDVVVQNIKKKGVEGVEAYVDNILIHSKSIDEHYKLLQAVFDEIRKFNLTLRPDKCEIAFIEINFLGYHVCENSIKPSQENVIKILNFPAPTTKKQVQRFLGLANFNRRFVQQYATITKPLTAMLSDDMKFMWTELQEKAFMAIRERLSTYPCLTIPDWEKSFHIETDASAVATGAILYQLGNDGVKYPIVYHSKTLSKPQTKWSATERELFAIVDATRKFKVYCTGDVHVHTDHQHLKNIRRQKDPRGKIGRWLLHFDAIDCKIEYLPGSENCGADCLSREVIPNPIHYGKYEDIAEETIYNATQEQVRVDYESPASMKKEQLRDLCISSAVRQLQRGGSIKSGPY